MAKVEYPPDPVPRDSALLKCESCGGAKRVSLNQCEHCAGPETSWYERRIALLESKLSGQNEQIRAQVDKLNNYSARERRIVNEVYEVCKDYHPDVDGSGCDSGDPFDLLVADVRDMGNEMLVRIARLQEGDTDE